LGFSDSDFEISPTRPTKFFYEEPVTSGFRRRGRSALTEKERREAKIQQELSGARRRSREGQVSWGWKNVAVEGVERVVIPRVKGKGRAVWVDQ